jgi:flagellar protein FlaG
MESVAVAPQSAVPIKNIPSTPSVETKVEVKNEQITKTDSQLENSADINNTKKNSVDPKEVVSEFNETSQALNLDVKFAYNEKINEVYINVTNKQTGEVIRKLPTEEAMKIKESMKDLVGVLFDQKG